MNSSELTTATTGIPSDRPLHLPVILGTARQGRTSEQVAAFLHSEVARRPNVTTELIDVRTLALTNQDAGQGAGDPGFTAAMEKADGLIIVTPEYNHGYPGLLKHALDTNLKEYIHKPVGLCGVSAGGFGGTRVIQNLLPVLRELGLVTLFWDGNFSGAQGLFDAAGAIKDTAYVGRIEKFLNELIWMAKVLRYGREHVAM